MLLCCHKQYVGRTWRQLNIRFNIHRNQARKKQTQFCDLVRHVVRQGLSFDDVEITIIEQLKGSSNLTEEQQMELLKNREIFWQNKLETLVPNGLNKRDG